MKLPRPPAAVIFDMDGLLFDTERLYGEAIMTAADEVGCAMSIEVFHKLVGVPWEANRIFLQERFGPTYPTEALIATWIRHFEALADTGPPMKPGVIELLDVLDELQLPRAIATSSSHATVRRYLASHKLTDRFQDAVAHGDYVNGKPAPDPYQRAAERLGVAPALCLALEDSHNGVRSAVAADMMTIMVPDQMTPTEEMRALCALVVVDLHDVCRLIKGAV